MGSILMHSKAFRASSSYAIFALTAALLSRTSVITPMIALYA
jgi:hypothetical protein